MTDIRFTRDHEYARIEGDVATVGISDYAQAQLGDIVFVETPPIGKTVAKGEALAVVESVKAASDVYSPVSGEVVEINAAIEGAPGLVNEEPMAKGWLVKLRLTQAGEADGLMDEPTYQAFVEAL